MEEGLPLTRTSLRASIARELRLPRLSDQTWQNLIDEGYVGSFFEGGRTEEKYRRIVRRARSARPKKPGRKPGQKSGAKQQPKLSPKERLRADVCSRELGRFASHEPEVLQLRADMLGGSVLTHKQAEHLLLQVAPRYLPLNWFVRNRISLLDHTSFFSNQTGVALPGEKGTEIHLEWGGKTKCLKNTVQLANESIERGTEMSLPLCPNNVYVSAPNAKGPRQSHLSVPVRSRGDLPESLRESLVFEWSKVRVLEASVFGEMQRISSRLAETYGWTERESLLFLTEGEVPFIAPISMGFGTYVASSFRRLTVTLEFEPWVSAGCVRNAYLHARRASLLNQQKLMETRRLQLFDFVEAYRDGNVGKSWEKIDEGGAPFPWKDVAKLWNAEHSNWRYRTVSELKAEFRRTSKELLLPPLTKLWG